MTGAGQVSGMQWGCRSTACTPAGSQGCNGLSGAPSLRPRPHNKDSRRRVLRQAPGVSLGTLALPALEQYPAYGTGSRRPSIGYPAMLWCETRPRSLLPMVRDQTPFPLATRPRSLLPPSLPRHIIRFSSAAICSGWRKMEPWSYTHP